MGVKRDLYNVNEEVRSAIGGALLESVGGTAQGPNLLHERESKLQKLNDATGKEHSIAEGDVSGVYVGKIELGGSEFARIQQEDGSFLLSEWSPEMTDFLGQEIEISRGGNGEFSITRAESNSITREL